MASPTGLGPPDGLPVVSRTTIGVGVGVIVRSGVDVGVGVASGADGVTLEITVSTGGVSVGVAVSVGVTGVVGGGGSVTVSVMSARGAASVGCTLTTAPPEINMSPTTNRHNETKPLLILGTLQLWN